jgi:predicted dehydrogenase
MKKGFESVGRGWQGGAVTNELIEAMNPIKPSNLNRRQFLQSTAVVAVPFLLPSRIWGATGDARPSNRITVGVIGTGTQGRHLMNSFLPHTTLQIVAVNDVDTTRREHHRKLVEGFYTTKLDRDFKGCAEYRDFRELVARKDIDAVIIATPDHWHAVPVVMAADAGKDIFCEKPLSMSIREGRAMVDAVRRNQRVFQTGSMQRSSREFHRACELVRNGRLGKIQRIVVGVGRPSKWCDLPAEEMEPGLDWDMWLGPAPVRPYHSVLSPRGVHTNFPNWRSYREYSGGMMTDWGAHHFDIAQWGLGMDDSGPVEIIPPANPASGTGLRYIYANGVEMLHDASRGGVLFVGEKGTIFVDRGRLEVKPESINEETIGPDEIQLYRSTNHYRDFVDCIRSRQKPICDVEVGARTAAVCHLGNLAYWNGRRLRWDPVREQFVGDPEANKWLEAQGRAPWRV